MEAVYDKLSRFTTANAFLPAFRGGIVKVVKVYDGDTIHVIGFIDESDVPYKFSVRLNGIDTPEMRGGSVAEKSAAIHARDMLASLILNRMIGIDVIGYDKYGRLLCACYTLDLEWGRLLDISQWMIDNRLAIAYGGGKKTAFSERGG